MVPPVKPVRFARTGYALAFAGSDVVLAGVIVLPDASVGEVPHLKETLPNKLPLLVRCPFNVAVVG